MTRPERFKDIFAALLEREGVSKNALSKRLEAMTGRPTESWRRRLNKYASGVEPGESTVVLISDALGVSRDEFPPAWTSSAASRGELEKAYTELEQEHAQLKQEHADLQQAHAALLRLLDDAEPA